MNPFLGQTLATIVRENYYASSVFEKHHLDFCCKGKRTLQQACEEKNINPSVILSELREATKNQAMKIDFQAMSLSSLIDHIIRVHHSYVKIYLPQIHSYVQRVAEKHGLRHPYMLDVLDLVTRLRAEMDVHMDNEEKHLFPWIKEIEAGIETAKDRKDLILEVYEHEHELAGSLLEKMRNITNGFKVPDDACTTFRLSLTMLHAFELDLHQHVHLENNILFPRTLQLLA